MQYLNAEFNDKSPEKKLDNYSTDVNGYSTDSDRSYLVIVGSGCYDDSSCG